MSEKSRSRSAAWLLIAAVAIGVVCCTAQYFANQSFWGDEASLVLNIREKPVPEIFGKLKYLQAAPPLFLLIERGLFATLGGSEMSLRLLPFACGLAGLLFFALLARRILPSPWDAAATLCFALADRVIFHDNEVKPYAGDVMACTLLLLLAVGPKLTIAPLRRLIWLTAAATVLMWISFPSLIVFAALSLSLMPSVVKRSVRGFAHYFLINLPVVVSFAGLLLVTRAAQQNAILADYWQDAFIDFKHPLAIPWWLVRRLVALCDYPLPATGPLVFAGMCMGVFALLLTRRTRLVPLLAFLAAPIAMALVPAALHRYPFDGARLTVFLTPCAVLLATIGFKAVADLLWPRVRQLSLLPMIAALGVAAFWCGLHLAVPRTRGHLRPIVAYVGAHARGDDTIYALDHQAFLCYWPADESRVRENIDRADQIPTQRFWIVWPFSHEHARVKPEPALKWAREFCRQESITYDKGAAAALFVREEGKLPAKLDPPYGGVEQLKARQQSRKISEPE